MNSNTQVIGAQIAGDFTLPSNPEQKLVFIAGGIGITPFRSMLKYLLDTQQRRDIVLWYANKTANEIVYKDVLSAASTKIGVKTFYTLTDATTVPRNWAGSVGRISEQMIVQTIPDYQERTYYLSGPPEMVRAYEQVLKHAPSAPYSIVTQPPLAPITIARRVLSIGSQSRAILSEEQHGRTRRPSVTQPPLSRKLVWWKR